MSLTADYSSEVATAVPISTKRATTTPTKTGMPTFTPALITPLPTQSSANTQSIVSPNGEWIAQTSYEQVAEQLHIQFKVFRADGTQTWTIVDDWQKSSVDYGYTQLRHWSHNSQDFYFSGIWVSGGRCEFFSIDSTWQKINVQTGQVTDVPLPLGRGHAISPDDRAIAYISPDAPLYLRIRDIESGQEQEVLLPVRDRETEAAEAGHIVWSPTGNAVVLTIANGNFCNSSKLDFALIRVDIPSLESNELILNSQDLLGALKWVQPNHILLSSWRGSWWIDATSGEPTRSPETPMP